MSDDIEAVILRTETAKKAIERVLVQYSAELGCIDDEFIVTVYPKNEEDAVPVQMSIVNLPF